MEAGMGTSVGAQRISFRDNSGEYDIQAQLWLPQGQLRAVVQIVHGINEYGGRYADYARFLNTQGIALAVHDHMGHGLTADVNHRLGFFTANDGWKNVVADAAAFSALLHQRFPEAPLIIFGHSMGSFITRCLLADYPNIYRAAIICGTTHHSQALYAMGRLVSRLEQLFRGKEGYSKLVQGLCLGSCFKAFPEEEHPAAWLTRDSAVYHAYGHDPHCRFLPCIEVYYQMFGGMSYMDRPSTYKRMPAELPLLLTGGEADPAGENGRCARTLLQLWQECGLNVELKLFPEARHEILNELNKQEIYEELLAWMEKYLGE